MVENMDTRFDFIDGEDELLAASLALIECLWLCFDADVEYTENAGFATVRKAVLGQRLTDGEGCNLDSLSVSAARFRRVVADRVDQSICGPSPAKAKAVPLLEEQGFAVQLRTRAEGKQQ